MASSSQAAAFGSGLIWLGLLVGIGSASASSPVPGFEADARPLVAAMTTKGVVAHMNELQWIADARGGHRAASSSGYAASVSYVRRKLEAAGYRTTTQKFDYPFFQERAAPALRHGSVNLVPGRDFQSLEFSGSATVTGRLVAINVQIPPPAVPSSTSGCRLADFPPAGASAAIAVIQRGGCEFDVKVDHAIAAGYDGVVVFNEGQPGRTDVVEGHLRDIVPIPVLGASYAAGKQLVKAARAGASGQVSVRARSETRQTYNIIAETTGGRSDRTVMVGAHLDSVPEGPGINDNGSGSAAVLELALQMARQKIKPANRVRFAWWGAEELGLYGSTHYVEALKPAARAAIMTYLNFDMIGSRNYVWFLQEGDPANPADALVESVFAAYFQRARLPFEKTEAAGNSDYLPFMEAGIPVGGLFSGATEIKTRRQASLFGGKAGLALDPCYHLRCDDHQRFSRRSVLVLSRAMADTVYKFAMTQRDPRGLRAARSAAAGQAAPAPARRAATPSSFAPEYRGHLLVR